MLLQLSFVLVTYTVYIHGQTVHNIVIEKGKPYDLISPEYPDVSWTDHTIEWNLKAQGDNDYLKLVCLDVRMVQYAPWTDDCPDVYLSAEDGKIEKKVCGNSVRDFVFKSVGPTMKVKSKTSTRGSNLFRCVVLNMGDPEPEEIVKMDPQGHARRFEIDGDTVTPTPNLDRLWIFESPPGTRMSFQCDITLDKKEPLCGWNAATFNNGEINVEICDNKHIVWFSKENKAKLRIQIDNYGHGRMTCVVQGITGPHPDEYDNIPLEEEDSSEFGMTPGARQTSCDCGRANKGPARIINGVEAKANEFPWMVHMYINHESPSGVVGFTCGASILTPRHVLSAAHCVVGLTLAKPENVRMELAKHDSQKPSGNEKIIVAERIFVPDIYMKKGLAYHDIAVVFTKETIDFSTPLVGPICLEREAYPLINKPITIMGWGLTEDKTYSPFLKKGKSRVVDSILCGAQPWDVCTTSKPDSFCSGDSGGPLSIVDPETNRYSQVSLVSRGSSCTDKFMISTLVAYFYDWIQDVIKETDPSVNTCHKV
uniref:Venom S1 protease 39 n=1 Tax=Oncocephalus sp. TaxID=2944721 RepID=A0AB38ZET8_9HEMI